MLHCARRREKGLVSLSDVRNFMIVGCFDWGTELRRGGRIVKGTPRSLKREVLVSIFCLAPMDESDDGWRSLDSFPFLHLGPVRCHVPRRDVCQTGRPERLEGRRRLLQVLSAATTRLRAVLEI